MSKRRLPSIALTICLSLAMACHSPGASLAEHLKRGDAFMAQNKVAEAILEYRGAIQTDKQSGEAHSKLAQAYLQSGDARRAYPEFIRAADIMPQSVEAQLKAGQMGLLAGLFEDAKDRADKILAIDQKSLDAQILKGNALAGLKDFDGAIAQVEGAIRTDPSQSIAYSSLAALQFAKGDTVQAEATFKRAILAAPNSAVARLALANLYWAMKRTPDAERLIKEAVALEPRNLLANRALAAFCLTSGRTADAEAPLKVIAEDAPGAEGRLALADYYIAAQRLTDAKPLLEQIAQDPVQGTAAKLRLAGLGLLDSDRAGADRLIEEILAKDPKDADALVAKAQLQLSDGKGADALTSAKAAVAARPDSPQAQYVLGKVLVANGDSESATAAYKNALRISTRFAPANVELARLALQAGRNADAIEFAEGAIHAVPTYADAHLLLARAQIASGNPKAAEQPLHLLTENFPNLPVVQVEVARLLLAKGDQAGARTAFERTLTLDKAQPGAIEGLTMLDLAEKKRDAARARVDAAASASPNNPSIQVLAGKTYALLGDYAAAERSLKQALNADANNMSAYDLLAQLYLKEKRLPDATVAFQRVADGEPKAIAPRTAVAILLEMQNQRDAAKTRYEQVLAINPRAAVAANNLAQIHADRNESLDVALELAQTAKAVLPNVSDVDDTLGFVYYRKGLSSLAIGSLKQCVAAQPENTLYLYHLGLAYVQAGNKVLARQTLEKALRINSQFDGADDARKVLSSIQG